ncbi:MAG: hypothetical protein ACI9IA_002581 [Enterobacterales bacterium]|jgi:hypothetical protein
MKRLTRQLRDKIAMALSMFCVLQCLFLPFLISFLPLMDIWWLSDTFLHPFLLLVVIPLTVLTLYPSFKHHNNLLPILIAIPAMILLITGAFIHEGLVEKSLTIGGAIILASAHLQNMLLSKATYSAEVG